MHTADREGNCGAREWSEKVCYKSWFDFVVGIYKADIIAGDFFDAVVSGGGLALVVLVDYCDTGVFFCVFVGDFAGIVGRTVIY